MIETPAQKNAILTWTEQRDLLLKEIGVLNTEKETIQKANKEEAASAEELRLKSAEIQGTLYVLEVLENRQKSSLSIEIVELEKRKSQLEAEITAKEAESKVFDKTKVEKMTSIELLSMVHTKVSEQTKVLEETVGKVIKSAETHTSNMVEMVSNIETIATQVIDKSNKNVEQTNIVLEKLPRYIFELEKPIPLRKTYAAKAGAKIEPEEK